MVRARPAAEPRRPRAVPAAPKGARRGAASTPAKQVESAPVAPSTPAPSIVPADDSATEGQRLLRAAKGSLSEIAKQVGVSKPLVGFWRGGQKVPSPEARRALESLFAIPIGAWDIRAGEVQAKPEPAVGLLDGLDEKVTNRAGAERQLAEIRRRSANTLTVKEFVQLCDAETRTRALIERMEQAEQLTETKIVTSPVMVRIRNTIFATLQAHPAALRAVADALRGTGAEA